MKFSRFTSFPGRYAFWRHLFPALVSGSICLFSCEDDMDRPSLSPHVSFTSEISSSWTLSTRSATDTDAPQGTVTALQGGSTPLYLHTLYTDSIASSSPDSRLDTTVLTRAAPIKSDNMYDSFGVSAYSYTDSWSESKTPDYFYNATASKSGSYYTLSSTYYWPGSSYQMRFFAYAPKDNGNYVLSNSTYPGSPTISVTIPSNVNDQKDLLVAKTDELAGNTNTAVPLTFNHALTSIRFVCGDDMQGGTVKSVSLKNVYSTGTYNMEVRSWNNVGTPATFSQTLNKVTTGTADEVLTAEIQTFMMLPQTLPDGAQLEVVFTDNSSVEHTLTAAIEGTSWPIGKTVTYKISSSSINWTYTLTVTEQAEFTYNGGTQQYSVTSYRENGLGDKEPVSWSTKYSTDNGSSWSDTRPDWLTLTTSGSGSETAQSYDVVLSPQKGTSADPHMATLKAAVAKGSQESPHNLANQSNGNTTNENTANCYVVSAPGYYSFPLVYGNAIKNSTTNSSAYTSTATGSRILTQFIRHDGQNITDPYISNNGFTPVSAELLWQDALNLVSDVKYNVGANGGNISFKIDKDYIQQGNAVIAVKDADGAVLWSWHIWVTDEIIDNAVRVTNKEGKIYQLMSVYLGWCDGNTVDYTERSCKVKFVAGNQEKEITLEQSAKTIIHGRNNTFYQLGRHTPVLGSNGIYDATVNTIKTWYKADNSPSNDTPYKLADFGQQAANVSAKVAYPMTLDSIAANSYYLNLWNAEYNPDKKDYVASSYVKTVYDPSPVGFMVADSKCATYFLEQGNAYFDSAKNGWNAYTDSSHTSTFFFPLTGYGYELHAHTPRWGNVELSSHPRFSDMYYTTSKSPKSMAKIGNSNGLAISSIKFNVATGKLRAANSVVCCKEY